MKKIFVVHLLLLAICMPICAMEEFNAQEFRRIECELTPRIRSQGLDPHTHPFIPSDQHRAGVQQNTSTNWAGYAAVTNLAHPVAHTVSYVAGTWTIPQLSASTGQTYCSIWVGMDGYGSNSVEQLGTAHDWVNGKQQNTAWFEMYPQYPYTINGFPVNVGDSISASVVYQGNSVFLLTITNNTKKVYFVAPTSYTKSVTAQRISAEWIVEAPFSNTVLPLSHFGTVNLSNCIATMNNVQGAINSPHWQADALTMITNTNAVKAAVSPLANNGKNFSVVWKHE